MRQGYDCRRERVRLREGEAVRHGCCIDKACKPDTCMELPAGVRCDDCGRFSGCLRFGVTKTGHTHCDWFPRQFVAKPCADCRGSRG